MELFVFKFQGDAIIVPADSLESARPRAFYEVVAEYDVDPDRLQTIGWPGETDVGRLPSDQPSIIDGGG